MSALVSGVFQQWKAQGLGVQLRPGRRSRWLLALTVGGVVLSLVLSFQRARTDIEVEQRRLLVSDRLARFRAQLEQELASSFGAADGLAVIVATQRRIGRPEFERYARHVAAESRYIRNVTVAPGNRIAAVYPRSDRESLEGFSLLQRVEDAIAVRSAMETRRPVLGGPIRLVQGGEGLVVRSPVFLESETDSAAPTYWGMVSIVIDADVLLAEAGLPPQDDRVRYALRGINGTGASGPVWFGDSTVLSGAPLTVSVTMPGGWSWALSGVPLDGWQPADPLVSGNVWLGYLAALLAGTVAYWLLRERQLVSHIALHDPLSGLPNRLLVNDRLSQAVRAAARAGHKAAVISLDLDDFKPVNDTYGHHVGDALLAQVGDRLRRAVRESDTVGRIGGDEFLVILPSVHGLADAAAVARKISASLSAPFVIAGDSPQIGTSYGIALYPDDAISVPGLLSVADARLYEEKDRKLERVPSLSPVGSARIDRVG